MSELGQIADLLESGCEPGLAAAVRVLEYCEAEGIRVTSFPDGDEVTVWVLIDRASTRLIAMGHPALAERLDVIHRDIMSYGHILPPQPSTKARNSAS